MKADVSQPEQPQSDNPQQKDALAAFFGQSTAPDKPSLDLAQKAHDLMQARKPAGERRKEIDTCIADDLNESTQRGRSLGHTLTGFTETTDMGEIVQYLEGNIAQRFQQTRPQDAKGLTEALIARLEELEVGGKGDIFRDLPDAEATAAEGTRRLAGQHELQHIKTLLLGLSEQLMTNGHIAEAARIAHELRVDWIHTEPVWYTSATAQALEQADIENPDVRAAIVHVFQASIYATPFEQEVETYVAEPVEKLTPRQRIGKRGLEALQLQRKVETEEAKRQKKENHDNRLVEAMRAKVAAAIADGRTMFNQHYQGGSTWVVRFAQQGIGSAMIDLVRLRDWNLYREINDQDNLQGATGYIYALDRIIQVPGLMDRLASVVSSQSYLDLAGWSTHEYEEYGQQADWQNHFRSQLLTEAYGNAMGCLQSAVELEDKWFDENTRSQVLQSALEVLGGGNAQAFLSGQGSLTQEQQSVRAAFADYLTQLQQATADQLPDAVKSRRLERMKSLGQLAQKADAAVYHRKERARKETAEKAVRDAQRREELRQILSRSQQALTDIQDLRVRLTNLRQEGVHFSDLLNARAEEFISIEEHKTGEDKKNPYITVAIKDDKTAAAIDEKVKAIDAKLTAPNLSPGDRDELLNQRAELRVEHAFVIEVQKLLETVNQSKYRTTRSVRRKIGIGSSEVSAIQDSVFEELPQEDTAQDLGIGFNDIVTTVLRNIDRSRETGREKPLTLEQLTNEITTQAAAEDLLPLDTQIRYRETDLTRRKNTANTEFNKYNLRLADAIRNRARSFVYWSVRSYLRNQERIAH